MADNVRVIIPRTLVVDLTEFGWGIREVRVIAGGGGSQPGPNTVGTEQIIDDSVTMDDLNQGVKDTMMTGDDRVTPKELEDFNV